MLSVRVLGNSISFLQKQLLSSSAFAPPFRSLPIFRTMSTGSESLAMIKFVECLDNLKNYEKAGVPRNAGINSADGFDLGRMRRLMERLGNPQLKYKFVHISGTEGKGSTAAEGYSVGCYTSPHLQTIREPMTLGSQGHPVSEDQLLHLFQKVRKILEQVPTAIAFALFAQEKIDIAVVEAGLGGTRDATNIIELCPYISYNNHKRGSYG